MFRVSASIAINRPLEEVFAYVADPHNQQNWQPGLHEVRTEGEHHIEVRKIMGRRIEHLMRRTDMAENQRLTYQATGLGHQSTLITHITFSDTGRSTTVTLELEVDTKGMLKSGEPTMERVVQREIRSDLELLKDVLEAHDDLHSAMAAQFPKHSEGIS